MCNVCHENPENEGCRVTLTTKGEAGQRIPVCHHCFRWIRKTLDWISELPETANA